MRPLLLLLLPMSAVAQTIPVTLDVQPRTFTLPQTLTVTWNAPAPAVNCTASGGWSGAKGTSGTEQVAGALGTVAFNLTCAGATPTVTVTWVNPTKNIDGTNYTNPKHVEVYRSGVASDVGSVSGATVPHPQTSYVFSGLPPGTSHFGTKAVNTNNAKSALSNTTSKDVQAATGSAPPVSVTGTQPAPTGVVSVSKDGYAVKASIAVIDYVLDGIVGTVQLGAPCDSLRQMGGTDYYAINRAKYVTWTTNRRPGTVVVQCAAPPSGTVKSEEAPLGEDEE